MENKNNELMIQQLAKELRITRFFCIISSVLTASLLLGGFLVWNKLQPMISVLQEAQPVIEHLSALDVDVINEAVEGLDTEELNKAIENLNKTTEAMENLGEKIKSFTGFFN